MKTTLTFFPKKSDETFEVTAEVSLSGDADILSVALLNEETGTTTEYDLATFLAKYELEAYDMVLDYASALEHEAKDWHDANAFDHYYDR